MLIEVELIEEFCERQLDGTDEPYVHDAAGRLLFPNGAILHGEFRMEPPPPGRDLDRLREQYWQCRYDDIHRRFQAVRANLHLRASFMGRSANVPPPVPEEIEELERMAAEVGRVRQRWEKAKDVLTEFDPMAAWAEQLAEERAEGERLQMEIMSITPTAPQEKER